MVLKLPRPSSSWSLSSKWTAISGVGSMAMLLSPRFGPKKASARKTATSAKNSRHAGRAWNAMPSTTGASKRPGGGGGPVDTGTYGAAAGAGARGTADTAACDGVTGGAPTTIGAATGIVGGAVAATGMVG